MTTAETTGWRDEALSRRHREWWGHDCPAVDLDFVLLEYDHGAPVALVDYKLATTRERVSLAHPSYAAIIALADAAKIPALVAFYWPSRWCFHVAPLNAAAERAFPADHRSLSERQFVLALHRLRSRQLERTILEQLSSEPVPPSATLPAIIARGVAA